jgi:formamidopyrimidine-DNA glycosylase
MPELPEVEVLVRNLRPLLRHRTIRAVHVRRPKVIQPDSPAQLRRALHGSTFLTVRRRGKYLLFLLRPQANRPAFPLLGHLGMTGRMYLQDLNTPLHRHAAVILNLGTLQLVFEDTRYFGRLTLDTSPLNKLGPEPFSNACAATSLHASLQRSTQPIKVKLLDQTLIAGIGNIYASEALFTARIHPSTPACKLNLRQVRILRTAVRHVLSKAIRRGSTVPLDWNGTGPRDGLFYYGQSPSASGHYREQLHVYNRAGSPCPSCGNPISRIVQAARSTFLCPRCQILC